jgi:hypothetical protein
MRLPSARLHSGRKNHRLLPLTADRGFVGLVFRQHPRKLFSCHRLTCPVACEKMRPLYAGQKQ